MNSVFAIAQRELKSYFASPVAYVVTGLFLVMSGYLFSAILVQSQEASMRFIMQNLSVIFLFIMPFLTMRLLAEEQRTGTVEILLTNPVRDHEVVIGKFLGATVFFLVMLLFTLYYPFLLFTYGNPDRGPIMSGYLGLLLQGHGFPGGWLVRFVTHPESDHRRGSYLYRAAGALARGSGVQHLGLPNERHPSVFEHHQPFPGLSTGRD